MIIIKKRISRKIIQRIPRSNFLSKPTNDQEQSFQMASLHSTPRIIEVRPIDKNYGGDLFVLHNSKYNKNIINLPGLFIIGMIYCIGTILALSSRFGWMMYPQGILYLFVVYCSIPVFLPAIHFMRNPKHLKSVLRDHK